MFEIKCCQFAIHTEIVGFTVYLSYTAAFTHLWMGRSTVSMSLVEWGTHQTGKGVNMSIFYILLNIITQLKSFRLKVPLKSNITFVVTVKTHPNLTCLQI